MLMSDEAMSNWYEHANERYPGWCFGDIDTTNYPVYICTLWDAEGRQERFWFFVQADQTLVEVPPTSL